MVDVSEKFKKFLKAYDAHGLAIAENYEREPEKYEAEMNSVKSKWARDFENWSRLPQEIIDAFNGQVPAWILEIAEERNLDELRILKENPYMKKNAVEEKAEAEYTKQRDAMFVAEAATVAVMAAPIVAQGYSQSAAEGLAVERLFRDDLLKKFKEGKITEEEKAALWRLSRLHTRRLIERDWKMVQPERMLVHMLAHYSRGRVRPEDEAQFAEKLAEMVQKIQNGYTDKNGRVHASRADKLDEYLQHPLVQAKLRHMTRDEARSERLGRILDLIDAQVHGKETPREKTASKELRQDFIRQQDLPLDVMDILKRMQLVQSNRSSIMESTLSKREKIENISSLSPAENMRAAQGREGR